mmetsp:Transcript_2942/g.5610  ORF Transcript_2942/g.5610 Transcript_2942/m.5610 type:complete len:265 (+) Transcript_2942:17-811(+)
MRAPGQAAWNGVRLVAQRRSGSYALEISRAFQEQKAVVLRGFARTWPALDRWDDLEVFAESVGDATAPIEVGGSYLAAERQRIHLADYLMVLKQLEEDVTGEVKAQVPRMYLAQHDLISDVPSLSEDIIVPAEIIGNCGKGHIQRTNFWIGPPECFSPMHKDPFHNLFVHMRGKKSVLLCPSLFSHCLDLHPPPQQNTSRLDFAACNGDADALFRAFPQLDEAGTEMETATLSPGDAIYIPKGCFHYFASEGSKATASVNFWWL